MNKRLQVVVSEEAWSAIDAAVKEANESFDGGSISTSDVVNEMILHARLEIKALQLKHTDLKKSLMALAKKPDIDVDTVLKCLNELKSRPSKKRPTPTQQEML